MRAQPIPAGVPVTRTSPGLKVIASLIMAISVSTSNSMSLVEADLDHGSVQPGLKSKPLAAGGRLVRGHETRAKRPRPVEVFADGPLRRFELILANRRVVEDRIAGHMAQRVLARNVASAGTDDRDHFPFEIEAFAAPGTNQGLTVSDEAAREAREQSRIVGLLVGRFLRVIGIVQPDTDDFRRIGERRPVNEFFGIERRSVLERSPDDVQGIPAFRDERAEIDRMLGARLHKTVQPAPGRDEQVRALHFFGN